MYQITLPHMLTENTQRALLTSHLKPQTTMDELGELFNVLCPSNTKVLISLYRCTGLLFGYPLKNMQDVNHLNKIRIIKSHKTKH